MTDTDTLRNNAQKLRDTLSPVRLLIFGTYKTLFGYADSLDATSDAPEDYADILASAQIFIAELKPLLEKRGVSW